VKQSLIIDCDPGVDDGVALLLAFGSPKLDLLAITTVAGNVDADLTARNARIIRQIAGREDVPVHAGAHGPMVRAPIEAAHFHGVSGLGDMAVFEPAAPLADGHAAQAIIGAVMARPPGRVDIAVTGPMTNLALAMRLEPALSARLGTVAVMGGARSEGGNITASAEYNIYADPHAAQVVFGSGATVVAFGLDATHQVRTNPARMAAIASVGNDKARTVIELLTFSERCELEFAKRAGAVMHDSSPIAWLIDRSLFTVVPARIEVETISPLTLGHTAVEFRIEDPAACRTFWATKADADGLFDLLIEALA
jgi:purine nucleosidase